MRALFVAVTQVLGDADVTGDPVHRGFKWIWSYLSVRERRSMNTLLIALPTPSIEIATSASFRTEVNSSEVNWGDPDPC